MIINGVQINRRMIGLFFTFLKKENVLNEFIKIVYVQQNYRNYLKQLSYNSIRSPHNMLISLFDFRCTKQGLKFWYSVQEKWLIYLYNKGFLTKKRAINLAYLYNFDNFKEILDEISH